MEANTALDAAPTWHAALPDGLANDAMNGTPQRVTVFINGHLVRFDQMPTISYERLCEEAGKHPATLQTVVYSLPDGRVGGVTPGEVAPLVDGGVYNVMMTGGA